VRSSSHASQTSGASAWRPLLGLCLLLALSQFACDKAEVVCEPNETRTCICAARAPGAQSCSADGTVWSVCDCYLNDDLDASGRARAQDVTSTWTPQDAYSPGPQTDTSHASDGAGGHDGAQLFATYCAGCHGPDGTGAGFAPNIHEDVHEEDLDELIEVILEGDDDMPPISVTHDQALAIVLWMRATFPVPLDDEFDDD